MPRPSNADSIAQIVRAAAEGVVARASASISRAVSSLVAESLARRRRTDAQRRSRPGGRARGPARGRRRGEIRKWSADRRARRVPNFVIEATGLDTKKKIVARFGEGATFQKGKLLPQPRPEAIKARPPIVRRKAAAT